MEIEKKTIFYSPFQHENHVRVSTHVRVNGHRKAELVILSVEVIEMISPQIFNVSWIYPTVRVRRLFDEHHRWQLLLKGKSGASTEWQDPCRAGS